jgi:hypothetical protein
VGLLYGVSTIRSSKSRRERKITVAGRERVVDRETEVVLNFPLVVLLVYRPIISNCHVVMK